jgi:hypothetical protein
MVLHTLAIETQDICYIQEPYFIRQIPFVTVARVGGWLSGLRYYDKEADRKWQRYLTGKVRTLYNKIYSCKTIIFFFVKLCFISII